MIENTMIREISDVTTYSSAKNISIRKRISKYMKTVSKSDEPMYSIVSRDI